MIVRYRGVQAITAKGRTYYYHRKTKTRLPGLPGSAEFTAKLRDLEQGKAKPAATNTVGGLISAYRASPEFTSLAGATQTLYKVAFAELQKIDAMPLAQMSTDWLYQYRDKKAKERTWSFANLTITVLRLVFKWGVQRNKCKVNPAIEVARIRRPKNTPDRNIPWRKGEFELVMIEAPRWLRVPIAIAYYTGLRELDVMNATWSCYDGAAFETRMHKTGKPVWVPAHPQLREILDAAPRVHDRIVVGISGTPIGRSAMTTVFFKLLKRLREDGKVRAGVNFHGLRHSLGTALAEAGCDMATIAEVLGHSTPRTSERYTRKADRRKLVRDAFGRLEV